EVVYNSIPELTLEVDDARETENQDSESNSSVHDRPSDYYNPYSTPLPSLRKSGGGMRRQTPLSTGGHSEVQRARLKYGSR
ncbi:hypothetical protein JTE90_023272, partial [Oedothorax gibbosus]